MIKVVANSIFNLILKTWNSICALAQPLPWRIALIVAASFMLSVPSYAATSTPAPNPEVIQPFELTNPAATRSEAYDEVAKLNSNPKELMAAENKEEKAEEDLYKEQEKAAKAEATK